MSKGIDDLAGVIDSLLDVDPAELSDDELHELVTAIQRQRHRLAAVAATTISAWDRRMVWADNGARSAATRLANDTSDVDGVDGHRGPTRPPAPLDASNDGSARLGPSSPPTTSICSPRPTAPGEATASPTTRRRWSTSARGCASSTPARWSTTGAPGPTPTPPRTKPSVNATLHISTWHPPSTAPWWSTGSSTRSAARSSSDELTRLERELYLADQREGVTRTASQRRAAALVEMATRSATAPANGRRPKPLFTALVGDATLSQLCELANGTVVTPGQLVRWIDDADLETVLFDGPSTVISVSHRRSFSGALRRAVEVRDRRCQHDSGCDVPADRCDVDHIVPYAADGPTSQFNGKLECPPHNRNSDRHDHGGTPRPADRSTASTRSDVGCAGRSSAKSPTTTGYSPPTDGFSASSSA